MLKKISPFIQRNYFFNWLFVGFIAAGIIPLLLFSREELTLLLNKHSFELADTFFVRFTFLGNGIFWVVIILVFSFLRFRHMISAFSILLLNGLFTFTLKKLIFSGMPRPTALIPQDSFYHLIDGYAYHSMNTFPSGHTLTAFSIAFFLSYQFRDPKVSLVLFLYALSIGFSRVYLLQHFYTDVYAGAIVGFLCFFLGMFLTESVFHLGGYRWGDYSLRLKLHHPDVRVEPV